MLACLQKVFVGYNFLRISCYFLHCDKYENSWGTPVGDGMFINLQSDEILEK